MVFTQLAEHGSMLLHLDTDAYFNLNEVGALIWDCIAEPVSVGQLRDQVALRLDDPPPSLEADLSDFLKHLADRGLIALEPPPGLGF